MWVRQWIGLDSCVGRTVSWAGLGWIEWTVGLVVKLIRVGQKVEDAENNLIVTKFISFCWDRLDRLLYFFYVSTCIFYEAYSFIYDHIFFDNL